VLREVARTSKDFRAQLNLLAPQQQALLQVHCIGIEGKHPRGTVCIPYLDINFFYFPMPPECFFSNAAIGNISSRFRYGICTRELFWIKVSAQATLHRKEPPEPPRLTTTTLALLATRPYPRPPAL